ncbi:MAG: hypothetical protein ACREV3_10085 [Gammaproteobacteria bacterium]
MESTKRGRFRSAFWRSIGVFLLSVPLGTNAVEISNGIPAGTVGHFLVNVDDAGTTRRVIVSAARFGSDNIDTRSIVRNYYSFIDRGNIGLGERLLGPPSVPDPINPNSVTNNGFFKGANQNRIFWSTVSSIAPGAQVMTTTYTFIAETGVLGPLRFLQHLDGVVLEGSDDVFFHRGSAVGGDLKLFTFDNTDVYGISHSGAVLQNASFAGWAADHFDNIVSSISTGGQPVSPDGIIANLSSFQHPQLGPVFGPADNVSVLAWDVDANATRADIITSLGAVPISVEARPSRSLSLRKRVRCGPRRCSVPVTCVIANAPGASCTNEVKLMVTRKALRTRDGAMKAPQLLFASGTANVRSGGNGKVQLRLTKRARKFVRSTTKEKIRGTLEIESIDEVAVNALRVRVSIVK